MRRFAVVSSKGTSYFNDMLGTTVGAKSGKQYSAATLSAFGARELEKGVGVGERRENLFFTGKPEVAGLGYAFLMRNYRAGLGKWQTADPMGYPDGWNQLKYGINSPLTGCDLYGAMWDQYEYRTLYYIERYEGYCYLPGGLPLDVGSVSPGFWNTLLGVFAGVGAEALVDCAKDVVLPLWKLYAAEYNISSPSRETCEEEMKDNGFEDWEFVGVEFFSGSSGAQHIGEVTVITWFNVTYKITMRKLKE